MTWHDLYEFQALCASAGLAAPPPLVRGLELQLVASMHVATPPMTALDLTDDEARDRVTDLAIRANHSEMGYAAGLQPGVDAFSAQLLEEVRTACLPYVDDMVAEMRPTFDEQAAPLVTAAQEFGFTNSTTPTEVLDLADDTAAVVYRGSRSAIQAIMPAVRLRIALSRIFRVSPTVGETLRSDRSASADPASVNHSISFAAADNWSADDGYYIEGRTVGHLDWLALAAGGLRLNTPTEVRVKLAARTGVLLRD